MSDPLIRADERWPRGWRSLAFDAAVALLGVGGEVAQVLEAGDSRPLVIALAVLAGAALVARRRAPLAIFLVVFAASLGIEVAGDDSSGAAVLIALYTTAAALDRRVSLAALVLTVALLVTVILTGSGEGDSPKLADSAIGSGLCVGIWALGAYVQTQRRYRRELQERAADLEREQEQLAQIAAHEERASIARELHDIVAHSVSVMLVGVRGARDVLRSSPDVADETLARVETSGEQSLAELRRILALLRSPEQGAEARPQPSLAQLHELVAEYREAGLPVQLEVAGEPRPLPSGVELSVYRIVQEALTNSLKHARPTDVHVTLSFRGPSTLELEVVNDGGAAGHGAESTGHGIVGMRERVALLGGELETGPRVGGGFRVAAKLPLGSES
jgi:signal transduction histidine kinase